MPVFLESHLSKEEDSSSPNTVAERINTFVPPISESKKAIKPLIIGNLKKPHLLDAGVILFVLTPLEALNKLNEIKKIAGI